MSAKEALSEFKTFLESTPPNTPTKITGLSEKKGGAPGAIWFELKYPSIVQLHCPVGDGPRRFDLAANTSPSHGYQYLTYTCKDCDYSKKTCALLIVLKSVNDPLVTEVMKLGEYPPFGAPISARIQKLLHKDDLELYRKGSRAEAQGLGIGAASYFRRIVDSQWQLLVSEIREAAEKLGVEDLSVFDAALKETQFSKAVHMLKDAIPAKLRFLGGENPVTLLY